MRAFVATTLCLACLFAPAGISRAGETRADDSILIQHGYVIDGTGSARRKADVRVFGDSIVAVGQLTPEPGERVIDATGLIIAPGFIDAHSHADGGILLDQLAETQIRQGITTSVVGEDGASNTPLKKWFEQIEKNHVALNFASFVGHGTVRHIVMGDNYKRHVSESELDKMGAIIDQEMQSGALGLSTGLEYDPGFYSDTEELIVCSKVAAKYGGMYISHVRDEGNKAIESFKELIRIAQEAKIPGEINHIKLDTSPSWNRAPEVIQLIANARKRGTDITADVYPYTYWQSTIIVLIPTRNWDDRKAWEKGLSEVGGASHILLSSYTPNKAWAGKTISQIAAETQQDPISVIQEIVHKTHKSKDDDDKYKESESVVVTAMTEADVRAFVSDPAIMFCSDGSLKGSHPRGAGSFPRVLGHYVHDLHALTLESAIHKMTGLTAKRFGFIDRGRIAPGMKADITVFDPVKVHDTATTSQPMAAPIGIPYVLVNGQIVLDDGQFTGARPGMALRHVQTATVGIAQK